MSHLLYETPELFNRFLAVQKEFGENPILKFDINLYNMSRKDMVESYNPLLFKLLKAGQSIKEMIKYIDVSVYSNYKEVLLLP
jgi:hypothetical protein